jgi:DNA phosphorothioation-associated putative methyltransferase
MIKSDDTVFDYGCGLGEDVRLLHQDGFAAEGWDPFHRPRASIRQADIVHLGYVLNVIEDPSERAATLRKAFSLAQRLLIVAVRVDQSLDKGTPFADGVITGRGAFQKLYTQAEFRDYVKETLGVQPVMASLGVAYVFQDSGREAQYIAGTASARAQIWVREVLDSFKRDRIAQRFLKIAAKLGRPPLPEEFPSFAKLSQRFGSGQRISRIVNALLSEADIEVIRRRKRDELLLYISMMKLQGLRYPPFRCLPAPIQADLKLLWPSYQLAQKDGEAFLFQIGHETTVRDAILASKVGKQLPDARYFHRSSLDQLAPLLRLIVFAASQVVGQVEFDVVKLSLDGRKVSFLRYPLFDEEPHPALAYSIKVHLPTATHGLRDYQDSPNPPILHRKDSLVDPLHPLYADFRALTLNEEELGLLSRSDIGFRNQWASTLEAMRLQLSGHTIIPAADARVVCG